MGCSQSKRINTSAEYSCKADGTPLNGGVTKWKATLTTQEARNMYEMEGSVPPGSSDEILRLRYLLTEPVLLTQLAKYAKKVNYFPLILCWADILEFKYIDPNAVEYQLSQATYIFHRYILGEGCDPNNPCLIGQLADQQILRTLRSHLRSRLIVDGSVMSSASCSTSCEEYESVGLSSTTFDRLQHNILHLIDTLIYEPFKKTARYKESLEQMKGVYNRISVSDFEYMEELGEGGFGIVIRCRKKSTGKQYAMKIQTKERLLKTFKYTPERVTFEKQAVAICHHPFIISMDYAFQTEHLVVMVMDLGTAGTLSDALLLSERNALSEDRVCFYAAEIILALAHIHRMGMIYRDLKPQNVMLNADGHIKLVDLGGIVDVAGKFRSIVGEMEQNERLLLRNADDENADEKSTSSMNAGGAHGTIDNSQLLILSEFSASKVTNYNAPMQSAEPSPVPNMRAFGSFDPISKSIDPLPHFQQPAAPPTSVVAGAVHSGTTGTTNTSAPIAKTQGSFKFRMPSVDESFALAIPQMMHQISISNSRVAAAGGHSEVHMPKINGKTVSPVNSVAGLRKDVTGKDRANSIMGTFGYMAPEMISLFLNQNPEQKRGYTKAVDYWSLGVMICQLLTGQLPFKDPTQPSFFDQNYQGFVRELADFYGISPICTNLIIKLVQVDESRRLGSGARGVAQLKKHQFFTSIDWMLLGQKNVDPPYLPPETSIISDLPQQRPCNFMDMVVNLKKDSWFESNLTAEQQRYFNTWDYVSPGTLTLEMKIAEGAGDNTATNSLIAPPSPSTVGKAPPPKHQSSRVSVNATSSARVGESKKSMLTGLGRGTMGGSGSAMGSVFPSLDSAEQGGYHSTPLSRASSNIELLARIGKENSGTLAT